MSAEASKALLRWFYEEFDKGNLDAIGVSSFSNFREPCNQSNCGFLTRRIRLCLWTTLQGVASGEEQKTSRRQQQSRWGLL